MLIPATSARHSRQNTLLLFFAALSLGAVAVLQFYQFIRLVEFYFGMGIIGDASFYFGMGHGLLNGLQMYADLFESKPPMIFWLSELSLRLTGGDALYRVMQAVGLSCLALAISFATYYLSRSRPQPVPWLLSILAFLFGSALAAFVLSRGLGYETEGFAVVPASLALLLFAARPPGPRLRTWAIAVIALCITTVVLLKEPFSLSVLAGLLLLFRSRHDAIDALKAIGLAIALWLAVLLLTGTFHDYFSIDLPEMLFGRVTENASYHDYITNTLFAAPAPLWLRGLNILRLFLDAASPEYRSFPAFPALALALGSLFLAHRASDADVHERWQHFLWGALAVLLFVLCANLAFTFEQLVRFFGPQLPVRDPFVLLFSLLVVASLLACLATLIHLARSSRATLYRVATTCLALYLASTAVATGGDFAPHHFLFAVPLYVAAFLALIRAANVERIPSWIISLLAVIASLLILNVLAVPFSALSNNATKPIGLQPSTAAPASAFRASSRTFSEPLRMVIAIELELARIVTRQRFSPGAFDTAKRNDETLVTAAAHQARQLDALLDACHISRYFGTADTALLSGLTNHSPYQLVYGLQRAEPQPTFYFNTDLDNPFFHAKLVNDFNATPIIVTGPTGDFLFPDLAARFALEFSATPPPCAQPYLPIPALHVFFRH